MLTHIRYSTEFTLTTSSAGATTLRSFTASSHHLHHPHHLTSTHSSTWTPHHRECREARWMPWLTLPAFTHHVQSNEMTPNHVFLSGKPSSAAFFTAFRSGGFRFFCFLLFTSSWCSRIFFAFFRFLHFRNLGLLPATFFLPEHTITYKYCHFCFLLRSFNHSRQVFIRFQANKVFFFINVTEARRLRQLVNIDYFRFQFFESTGLSEHNTANVYRRQQNCFNCNWHTLVNDTDVFFNTSPILKIYQQILGRSESDQISLLPIGK